MDGAVGRRSGRRTRPKLQGRSWPAAEHDAVTGARDRLTACWEARGRRKRHGLKVAKLRACWLVSGDCSDAFRSDERGRHRTGCQEATRSMLEQSDLDGRKPAPARTRGRLRGARTEMGTGAITVWQRKRTQAQENHFVRHVALNTPTSSANNQSEERPARH